ncbi:MAG: hypothetical protein J0I20_15185 [Chloroflexi bacterium]|nr:hypothetical protein [Chloroflexota bacterium]OJV91344.1 MAG: hypothetical protein BGO39_27275 [Chloroflexi bacterium 54-19]
MAFTTIVSEGNLIPTDLLERLAEGELPGQRPADFGLTGNTRITDEIETAWADARAFWQAFQRYLRRLPDNATATSETREHWITPLLESLGYTLTYMPQAEIVDGRTFEISHRAGKDQSGPPVVVVGCRLPLDKRPATGRPRLSPHALLQEYLNSTEHLWGIVTNGERLRLLRDSSLTTRPTYLEFDLRAMLEGEKYTEFALLYRLLHRTRLPEGMSDVSRCLLEQYHQQANDEGGRVRDGLRDGVQEALEKLGNGFLDHPRNTRLKKALEEGQLSAIDYYRELLRLVYRLLFLMVGEERHLIANLVSDLESDETGTTSLARQSAVYNDFYSVTRLRRMTEQPAVGRGSYSDLWQGLLTTFRLLEDDTGATLLGISPLDGDLFGPEAIKNLQDTHLYNSVLLKAIRALSLYTDPATKTLRRVNYAALNVEELGSVYESLLDFRPVIDVSPRPGGYAATSFRLVSGTERKTTGSYYTRTELVQELIKSALEPVLQDRLEKAGRDSKARAAAILSIKVCDPACGSGHFLLAAARRLGTELARVRYGEDQPSPENFRRSIRLVIARCIYGVDYNPLAVDLCKLALWLEGHSAGLPLSFLDSHIRWGNSLVGAWSHLVETGIPDEAYNPVTGDDRAVASAFKKRNKEERDKQSGVVKGVAFSQPSLFEVAPADPLDKLAVLFRELDDAPDLTVGEVRAKAASFSRLQVQEYDRKTLFNLWTAAFFLPFAKTGERYPELPTTRILREYERSPRNATQAELIGRANGLAAENGFFHWELEFPHIFKESGGFDVVLGNPPWERIKLQEEEHFVDTPYILEAPNKAERTRRIEEWRHHKDAFKRERIQKFETAKHQAEAESRFVRASKRYPLTAVGDVNTYALFAEQYRILLNSKGYSGIISPTGIATDETTKYFFSDLIINKNLVKLLGFINEERIFPDVLHNFKFCILITTGSQKKIEKNDFTFLCFNFTQAQQQERHFELNRDDINLLNPNTGTCPIFRTKADADITKKIYKLVPILIDEKKDTNLWQIKFTSLFHMANDSDLFRKKNLKEHLPLYEGKMFYQFDHRFASYETLNEQERSHMLPEVNIENHQNPTYKIKPSYYIEASEVNKKLNSFTKRSWLIGFRDVTSSGLARTVIASIVPIAGLGNTAPLVFIENFRSQLICCFLTCLNSLVLDYIAKQKIGGMHLTFNYFRQLPILSPTSFNQIYQNYISERVLELVYTAWDMQPFGADVWSELDRAMRERVVKRWEECYRASGLEYREHNEYLAKLRGNLPATLASDEPPPPFIWHEERRANIRAELDAKIARLYGLTRDELRYILDPQDVYGPDFPGETFRVLKEKETRQYGEYRTRRLVLEKWDALVV